MTVKYRITTNSSHVPWEYFTRLNDARVRAHTLLAGGKCHSVYIDRLVYRKGKKLPVEEKFVVKYYGYDRKDGSAHFTRKLNKYDNAQNR
jgi:hypothetical protein